MILYIVSDKLTDCLAVQGPEAAWDIEEPFLPLEQLMGVFPAASAHCLPPICQELMTAPSSPIVEFYPQSFQLDPNGQKRKWQWIALLPFIDAARLRAGAYSNSPLQRVMTPFLK